MAEYIRKDLLLELAREYYSQGLKEEAVPVRAIRNIPSADVQPVVHGEWKEKETFHDENADVISEWQSVRCSVCNKYHTTPYLYCFTDYKFCPNCGADMRGET